MTDPRDDRIALLQMRLRAHEGLVDELQGMRAEMAAQLAARAAPTVASRRARWLRLYCVEDLHAAIRRACFDLDHPGYTEPPSGWIPVPDLYRPTKRRTHREIAAALLARLQDGREGEAAATRHAGVPLAEFAHQLDKGTIADALR